YVQQFGALAERTLKDAIAKADYSAVGDVATRYRQTDAGVEAARAIALRHLDRGEYSLALRWLGTVDGSDSSVQMLQTAVAQKLTGSDVRDTLPESIQLNGRTESAASLLDGVTTKNASGGGQPDWPMLMGSSDRRGAAVDRLPMLLAVWNQSLGQSEAVASSFRRVVRNVLDAQSGMLPAALPLVVGNRVVCRAVDGVSVFDKTSGELLWQTEREESTSVMLNPTRTRSPYSRGRSTQDDRIQEFVFRDSVHGLLSSDGRRLFVIESQAMPKQSYSMSRFPNAATSQKLAEATSNILAAYDIETGAVLWKIGGPDSNEPFKSPLAGEYFQGVPVPVGQDLFVIGERDNAVRLRVLDASTGEERWSQLLAFVDLPIERDFTRRFYVSQVTVANGIILCPTTADWLIAVNPLTRSILWARRHKAVGGTSSSRTSRRLRSVPPLGAQWAASAPVVVGQSVLFTPPESRHIEAVNLTTGELLWKKEKGSMAYLAGASDGNAIVVSRKTLAALDAESGKPIWQVRFESADVPAGRGVLSERFLHQPMSSGQVVTFSLADGKVVSRTGAGRSGQLVANLVMHDSGAILQTPMSLEAFELRPEQDGPADSVAWQIKSAQTALADGKTDEAIQQVDKLDSVELTTQQRERLQLLLKQALLDRVRQGSSTNADIDRLAALGADSELVARLRVVQQTDDKDFAKAFRQLVELYRNGTADAIAAEGNLQVRRDLWLQGQLFNAWKQMDEAARGDVEELIQSLAADEEKRLRFLEVFAFLPSAVDMQSEQCDAFLVDQRFCEAEQIMRNLRRFDSDQTAAVAKRCAEALAKAGQRVDAESMLHEFGLAGEIDSLPQEENPIADARERWGKVRWDVQRFTRSLSNVRLTESPAYREDIQFLRDYICLATANSSASRRISFFSLKQNKIVWSLPLRSTSIVRQVLPNGRSLLVIHGSTVTCVSPLEQKVLWEQSLPGNSIQVRRIFNPLRVAGRVDRPTQMSGRWRPVAICNEDYICIRGQQTIEIRDAVTGELRWSRDGVDPAAAVLGTTECVLIGTGLKQQAYRSIDGQPVDAAIKDLDSIYGVVGNSFLLIQHEGLLFRRRRARLYDPVRKVDVWSMKLDRLSRVALTGERQIVFTEEDGTISLVNVVSGEVSEFESDLDFDSENILMATDADRLYVASLNSGSSGKIVEQDLDGTLTVFGREAGKKLWDRKVSKGSLGLSFFRSQPVLLLSENQAEVGENGTKVQDLFLIEPNTGKVAKSITFGSRYSSGLNSRFEPDRNFIELAVGTNRTLRFLAEPMKPETP
ncbi:MAG: PQQ-binding-like beta-propeller repeat protein, partial [Planctomycetaceae bacterium]